MNPVLQLSVPLILASQSPRRRALLDRLEVPHEVHVSPADETLKGVTAPAKVVKTLAHRKAHAVAPHHPSALVLAADTVVAHEGDILNKPNSESDARHMLQRLNDTTHSVYTGMALVRATGERSVTVAERTNVVFGTLTDAEINAYVASGSPMDKAGAYGIQDHTGALFVDRIEGDFYNVVGLPLRCLYTTLRTQFGDLLNRPGASSS